MTARKTAAPKAPPKTNGHNDIPPALKAPEPAGPPVDTTNYQAEAQFWQMKYIELLMHSNQVISMLSRGAVVNALQGRSDVAAMLKQARQQ